jgi:hypothetical protein
MPKESEKLSPSAVNVAKSLVFAEDRHQHRRKKTNHTKPCEHNIEKSDREINYRYDPHFVLPALFHAHSGASIVIAEAGHIAAHFVHPMHIMGSTSAKIPLYTVIASTGHTFTQAPHATQFSRKTFAFFLFMTSAAIWSHPIFAVLLFL